MMPVRTVGMVVSILAGAAVLVGQAHAECVPLSGVDKARLVEYVQKKYKAPSSTELQMRDTGFVEGSCFRRLEFSSDAGWRAFRIELVASPDLRFLTREVLDSFRDPVAEEKQKAEALSAGLTRGEFPKRGSADAPVTLTVFSDFQCPYCSRFAAILKDLSPEEASRIQLVFRQMPLPMHPWARPAAEATACAEEQGHSYFWALHDFIFDHQRDLTRDNLFQKLAETAKPLSGFDSGRFASCVIERKSAARVDQDVAFGNENGVSGTPTVFINGERTQIVGVEQLRTLIGEIGR